MVSSQLILGAFWMQVNERWEWGSAPPLHGGPGVLKALSEEPCPSTNRSVTLNAISLAPPPGKSLQSCPTLCDPIDGSPTSSTVPGILQALKGETVPDSLPVTPKSPPTRRGPPRGTPSTPVFLPGESHGQRSLAGYSPWDHKESDMTEAT